MEHPIAYAQVRGWYGQNAAWLKARCREAKIKNYSKMTRHEMIEALVAARQEDR